MPSLIPFRKFSAIWAVSRNSSRVSVQFKKPKKTMKKIVGHPDIFSPACDCLNCGGTGCQFC